MSSWVSWLWWVSKYLSEVIQTYENYNQYLTEPSHFQLVPGVLKKGMWISRSMGRSYHSLGPIPYCQHHGVVIDVENECEPNEVVWVLHFSTDVLKRSTLKEFMDIERLVNVYADMNKKIEEPDHKSWDGKYNLITNNCEHFASFLINGFAQSKQVELVEKIAWNALWTREVELSDVYKRKLAGRYLV